MPAATATLNHALRSARNAEALAAWHAHRLKVDKLGMSAQPTGSGPCALFITVDDSICRSQIFPFYFYRRELSERWGVELSELRLQTYRERPGNVQGDVAVVCLQTWFDLTAHQLQQTIDGLRKRFPSARIVYLDWFAPTDLRFAEALHSHVDGYVKKNLFRDAGEYAKTTHGDTNLMDYYGRAYGIEYPPTHFSIPQGFMDKLVLGPGFVTADYMLPHVFAPEPPLGKRPRSIDLHARLGAKGTGWYSAMREHARRAVSELKGVKRVDGFGLGQREYMRELHDSTLCLSPFGYGEICWRDYEAVMCGSLLLKPDTSHVLTTPDIFVGQGDKQTYVPLRWDFADLEEKVHHYLARPDERERIVRNAYAVLHDYAANDGFLADAQRMLGL
jgi:hypothetical protein